MLKRFSTIASSNQLKRIGIFDVSHRHTCHEGNLIQQMFHMNEPEFQIESKQFHLPTHEWPGLPPPISPKEEPVDVSHVFNTIRNEFDVVVISGSADYVTDDSLEYLHPLLQLIRQCVNNDFKLVGICFGAQVIARALYDRNSVRRMLQSENGYIRMKLHEESDPHTLNIFRDMAYFNEKTGEKDLVCSVCHDDHIVWDELTSESSVSFHPELLLSSDYCKVHAFRIKECSLVLGTQFHPDFPVDAVEKIFEDDERERGIPTMREHFISAEAIEYGMRQFARGILNRI